MTRTIVPYMYIKAYKTALYLAFTGLLLSGCAAQTGDFPTISKRSIENLPINDQPDAERLAQRNAMPAIGLDSETEKELTNQSIEVRQSHNAFINNLARTRLSTAKAGAVGSESWAKAQSELSDLIVLRNRTTAALTAIDAMVISAQQSAVEQDVQVDMAPLLEAQRQAAALVASEDAELARLLQSLRR